MYSWDSGFLQSILPGGNVSRALTDATSFHHRDSVPLTWSTAPYAHAFLVPFLFLAYLARRPRTHLARLLLLPVVIIMTLECTTRYRFGAPGYNLSDLVRGVVVAAFMANVVHFAVTPEGMVKIGERYAGEFSVSSSEGNESGAGGAAARRTRLLPACISDTLDVVLLTRGIGWKCSEGLKVPATRRPQQRAAYIKATCLYIIQSFLFIDFFDTLVNSLPGTSTTNETIFFPTLPPLLRYTVSTMAHLHIGIMIILSLEIEYDILSLVGVGLCGQPPSAWPPLHDRPWRSRSLHEFWSRRWHQALRRSFLVCGGYPGWWLAGDTGMLFGTFLASGLYHEIGIYLGGAQMDWKVIAFFVAQPAGIVAEKVYRKYTGKRVDSWFGTLWTAVFVVGVGQMCTNSWVRRAGVDGPGTILVPPSISPTRLYLLPFVQKFIERA